MDPRGQSYRCGPKAALVLNARIGEGIVTCEPKDTDRYGRTLAICRVFGEDLGAWVVGWGWGTGLSRQCLAGVPRIGQRRGDIAVPDIGVSLPLFGSCRVV